MQHSLARCGCPVGEYHHESETPGGQPWEASDGAIYLLRELSTVVPDRAVMFLPELGNLVGDVNASPTPKRKLFPKNHHLWLLVGCLQGYCTNFREHPYLLETLYRLLPSIAQVWCTTHCSTPCFPLMRKLPPIAPVLVFAPQNLGKKRFKPYLDIFIGPLFHALSCGQVSTS